MTGGEIRFAPGELSLSDLRRIAGRDCRVELTGDWRAGVAAAAGTVAEMTHRDEPVYGVNTGFGLLARTRIHADQLGELQVRLVRSHMAGVGEYLDDDAVRLILALKANALARGYSGVRVELIELLLAMLDRGVLPCVPSQGSVGASGDLAPLAAIAGAMIGEGEARYQGEIMPAGAAFKKAGLEPIELAPKEGLALLNGTQVSTALALLGLFAAQDIFSAALIAGSMSVEAASGADTPFDARIHEVAGRPGQITVAGIMRNLMDGSRIRESHIDCSRVQDPYSLRCQPQVMGACLDQMDNAGAVLAREANAVSDNPLVFAGAGEVLSGGNFHAEPVAMAADQIAIALAEIGALSERRIALLVDPNMSGLPAFLAPDPGLNSGFMIAQVTAAALAGENQCLAFPASVTSLPTSANQEDHVSMAAYAGRRLGQMAENTRGIVAIELLAAAQGIEFHLPIETSKALKRYLGEVRALAAPYREDRPFTRDIETLKAAIGQGRAFAGLLPD
ncbi:MAG: histidine ammonia-lyase [Alphaproteobacteria bacterium]